MEARLYVNACFDRSDVLWSSHSFESCTLCVYFTII